MDPAVKISSRAGRIQPFHVMDLLARARKLEAAGRDVVHMEIGEPDFPTPEPVVAAGQQALADGHVHYTPALGLPALRDAVSRYYAERYGLSIDAGRVVITPGSSAGLLLLMAALVDEGDEVLLSDPGYPCNRNFVHLMGGVPVALPGAAAAGFQPMPEQVNEAWSSRTRALMVATPANPTGGQLGETDLRELADAVSGRQGVLIVDEIYQGLTYSGRDTTALALHRDDVVVVNSFSKYFGMTGWRVGWLVVPQALVPVMDRLAQNLYISAPTVAQHAAIAALAPSVRPLLDARRDEFRRRRDYLYAALGALGFGIASAPPGAFYLYADCSEFTNDSYAFTRNLLDEAGVAITPGRDFGVFEPQRHVRFAFTTSIERMREGVDRIEAFVGR
jgi:aspartate/methionine/tyrosine aminotransferase